VSASFTLPIVDRLRRRIVPVDLHTSLDEAADTIEELYEALEDLAERMMGAFPSLADTPEACRAKSALAKARGETA
jgi:hypothetical protein